MKKLFILGVSALATFTLLPELASAKNCPRSPNWSKSTRNSRCKVRSGVRSEKTIFRYKRKRSRSSTKTMRWAQSRAVAAAKYRCKKYGGSLIRRFWYRRIKYRNKNTFGFNTGFVVIRSKCWWSQRKFRRYFRGRPYLDRRTFTIRGTHFYKRKGLGSKKNACGKARAKAIKHISKKYKEKVTYFRTTRYRWKKRPFYVKCSLGYIAKFRKWKSRGGFRYRSW